MVSRLTRYILVHTTGYLILTLVFKCEQQLAHASKSHFLFASSFTNFALMMATSTLQTNRGFTVPCRERIYSLKIFEITSLILTSV